MSSADRRSGAFCAGAENAPLQVADSANARQREKNGAFSRGTAKKCRTPAWKGQHVMGRGRSEKQKQKLLYMAQLLYGRTDEDHPVTTQEVIDYLEANGIRSERKTVYTDMEELEDFGLDIIRVKERPGGYYLASRKFELAELKLLVDAVQASKFITTKKSRELIAKLETL